MAKPLFSAEETAKHEADTDRLSDKMRYEEVERIQKAFMIEGVKRAQARPEEYLNALLIMVGARGTEAVGFDSAFADSDTEEYARKLQKYDTPEARRNLYSLLMALTEVPRSWATSAFTRFLRGIGKQAGTKYHGAGMFGVRYGWREIEVSWISDLLTSNSSPNWVTYSRVLMSYANVKEEMEEPDPETGIVEYDENKFRAIRVERNVEFINKLCAMLEARGLGPIPTPADDKPKKERKVKIFKPGDIVRLRNLRDLPLPAHIRVPVTKVFKGKDGEKDQRIESHIEEIITKIDDVGYYRFYVVGKDNKAYKYYLGYDDKKYIDGAIFLGEWKGEIIKGREIKLDFHYYKSYK